MKRALVIALICVFGLGIGVAARPYLDFEQYLIPDGGAVAAGKLIVGVTFGASYIYEYPNPLVVRGGGEQQFGAVTFGGDLYAGVNDMWSVPSEPFFGLDLDLVWGYIGFGLQTEIGLGSDWDNWPLATPGIDYWDSTLEFIATVTDYFTFRAGADFAFDIYDYFDVRPYLRVRIGDQ